MVDRSCTHYIINGVTYDFSSYEKFQQYLEQLERDEGLTVKTERHEDGVVEVELSLPYYLQEGKA